MSKRRFSTLVLAASCAAQLLLLLPPSASASGGNPNGALVYSAGSMATSGTTYVPVGGGATGSSTETAVQTVIPGVTQVSGFTAVVGTAPGSGNSWAFTWRDNATSQALTCTISGTATSCSDTADSFTPAANDLIDIQVAPSGTPASTGVQLYAQLAGGTPWSSLTNPTAALSLSQGYASTFTCTLTSANCFTFQDTGTGNNSNFLLNIDTSSSPLSVVNPLRVGIEGVDQMKVMEFTGNNGGIYFGTTLSGGPFGAPDPVSHVPNSTDISKYVMTAGTGSFGVLRLYQGSASPGNQGILQIRQYGTTPGAFITTATGCLATDASDSCTAGAFSVSGSGAVAAASYTAGGNSVPVYTGSITAGDCAKWSASGVLADQGAACGSGGGTTWNNIGAATNNATFSNAGYSTTFNQTSAANWAWANTTGATSSASQDSPIWNLSGQYWNGTASASDTWSFQDQLSNTSPYDDTLSITHSGTSGLSVVTFFGSPGTAGAVVLQNCGKSTCNAIAADDNGGTARFSVSGSGGVDGASFGLNNGDWSVSTSGAVAAASYTAGGNSVPVYTGSITAGDCAKWSASGVLADQGAACGSGGGGLPSSWSVGTGNAVTATTTTDVVPFTIYPYATGTSSDLFDVCSSVTAGACSGTKYFAINSNGNMVLSATNMTWGTVGMQSTSGAYNAFAGGIGQASYNVFYAAGLTAPAFSSSVICSGTTCPTSGGTVPAGTYMFLTTFYSTSGSGFETTASPLGTATVAGTNNSSIPILLPTQTSGSAGVNVYSSTSSTQQSVTGATWNSGSATLMVSSTSALSTGTVIGVSGISPSGYNGVYAITGLTGTTITYALGSNPGSYSSGGLVSWFTKCGSYPYGGSWSAGTCPGSVTSGTLTINAPIASAPASSPPQGNNTGTTGVMSYLFPSINFRGALDVSGSAPGQDFGVLQAALTTNGIATVYTSGGNTTQNDLMCFSASETVSQCAASSTLSNFAGVSLVSGNSTTLTQYSGVAAIALASPANTTYDDAACTNATAGTVVDAGAAACSSGTQVGIITQTNGTPVTSVPVYLKPASGGGGSGTVNSGTQYQMGYYATTGTAISGDPSIMTDSGGDLTIGGSLVLPGTNNMIGSDADGNLELTSNQRVYSFQPFYQNTNSGGVAQFVMDAPGVDYTMLGSELESGGNSGVAIGFSPAITGSFTPVFTLDQTGATSLSAGASLGEQIPNASATGTTVNELVILTGAPSAAVAPTSAVTSGVIGIAAANAGTTGSVWTADHGEVGCVFDGGTTAGDYVQPSSTTAADCHDAGSTRPSSGEILGRVLSTNASAGTYIILVQLENQ